MVLPLLLKMPKTNKMLRNYYLLTTPYSGCRLEHLFGRLAMLSPRPKLKTDVSMHQQWLSDFMCCRTDEYQGCEIVAAILV